MRKTYCLLFLSLALQTWVFAQQKRFTVTAYYAGDTVQMNGYDAAKFTHVIFSFSHLNGNRLSVANYKDTLRIQRLVGLKKKNPQLKVLLSLGGWGGCATCSDVFSSDAARKEFVSSVKETVAFFAADGIDLDWEYPTISGYPGHLFQQQDKPNFTALIKGLRDSLGPKKEISFAAGGFQKFIDSAVDWKRVTPLVNRINLMTYDLVSGYATATGHHTPLYSTARQKESVHNAVTALEKKGVPASKIVIGAAFYGRVWDSVAAVGNGLYQAGKFKAYVPYKNFDSAYGEAQGFVRYWDETARAPYLYNTATCEYVTYDDKQSLTEKTKYALRKGLNGIMFWELSHDVLSNGLLDAIDAARQAESRRLQKARR